MVMLRPGRYRVVPLVEAESNPTIVALRKRIDDGVADVNQHALDFEANCSAVLEARVLRTQLNPSGSDWRLVLPKLATDILGIKPGRDDVVIVLAGRYIEVWSASAFHAALDGPVDEIP